MSSIAPTTTVNCGICLADMPASESIPRTNCPVSCQTANKTHTACLETWVNEKNNCPFCRTRDPLGRGEAVPHVIDPDQILEEPRLNFAERCWNNRRKILLTANLIGCSTIFGLNWIVGEGSSDLTKVAAMTTQIACITILSFGNMILASEAIPTRFFDYIGISNEPPAR